MSFEELPHTADVRIRARSKTLAGLFSELCEALMQVMYGSDRKGGTRKEITVTGADNEELLFNFLSEVLFVSETEDLVFSRSEISIGGGKLRAILEGEPFDPVRHRAGTEVKGISYTGLSVRNDANGYITEIVFDV